MIAAAARVSDQQLPAQQMLRALPAPARRSLSEVAEVWQVALDAAQRALDAGEATISADVHARRRELALERQSTRTLLVRLARETGSLPLPWLSPGPIEPRMLGLPVGIRACLFDLDGVLTDSGALHAWAWSEVFDPLLLRLSEQSGWAFRPFDPTLDYRDFVDGRPRLDGIHTFLASRGIRLPEGRSDDSASAETARGLARRKGDKLAQGLRHRGIQALPGARRYVESARRAGLRCAVVSASTSTRPMLDSAGLDSLVDERVDAELMVAKALRARPAPDLLLCACRRLAVAPAEAVTLTHNAAGVAAAHTAGLLVVGVGRGRLADDLRGFGATSVVPALSELLDPQLRTDQ